VPRKISLPIVLKREGPPQCAESGAGVNCAN